MPEMRHGERQGGAPTLTLPFSVPRELFDVEHRFVDLEGAHIHYVDEGRGETLLLLHGNPSWSFLYRKIIAALRDSFRCVALDYPGYGMSSSPHGYHYTPREHSRVVERFMERLKLHDVTLMVQDWGGPIGLGLAGRRPEWIRRLVIGNTWAWPLDGERRIRLFSWLMGGPIGRILTWAFNFVPRYFFSRGLSTQVPKEVLQAYLAPWQRRACRRPAVIAARQLIRASDYLREVESGLSRLADRPALIVWGTRDFAFGPQERERFEHLFSNHRTTLFDRASHFLQEDVGDEIAAEIYKWVSEMREFARR